jgi:hypothetical protein
MVRNLGVGLFGSESQYLFDGYRAWSLSQIVNVAKSDRPVRWSRMSLRSVRPKYCCSVGVGKSFKLRRVLFFASASNRLRSSKKQQSG